MVFSYPGKFILLTTLPLLINNVFVSKTLTGPGHEL